GLTRPVTASLIVGWSGSLLAISAVMRSGPVLPGIGVQRTTTTPSPPGRTGSGGTIASVQKQLLATNVRVKGWPPVFRTANLQSLGTEKSSSPASNSASFNSKRGGPDGVMRGTSCFCAVVTGSSVLEHPDAS